MEKLENTIVIVTGCGYKDVKRVFHNHRHAVILKKHGKEHKVNIGGATSLLLARSGIEVLMSARSEERLKVLQEFISDKTQGPVKFFACDLTNESQVQELGEFVKSHYKGKRIWLVQCVGLGAQAYKLKDDNPYLLLDEAEPELVVKEYEVIVNSLLLTLKAFLPAFKSQDETRVVVVNSMSGIRPYFRGFSHCAAKGGLYNAVRSLTLEFFYKYENVFVSQVMPGIADTGVYDSEAVLSAISEIGETFGLHGDKKWKTENFPLISPESVAEAVWLCLTSDAQILELDMVARGQIPHKGA